MRTGIIYTKAAFNGFYKAYVSSAVSLIIIKVREVIARRNPIGGSPFRAIGRVCLAGGFCGIPPIGCFSSRPRYKS